ncbi:MAG: helix-turn-helix domain-containing protein [Bacteroidales bacterium]|nr:helix-turn-helix domain-containing protein [Bacteroidales bacterium]
MKIRFPLIICITLLSCLHFAYADTNHHTYVKRGLAQYEESQGGKHIETANQLMKMFHNVDLTPELVIFDSSTPESTISREIFYWASEYFYELQDFKTALNYGLKALPLSHGSDIEADCLSLLSLIHFRLSRYDDAAEYAKQCYKIDEQSGDPDIMSSSLNTIAGIYLGANRAEEGEKYILKAIELASKANNPSRMSVIRGMASEIFHAQGKNQEALYHIEEACKIEESLQREGKMMVRLTQKASILVGLNRWEEAEHTLERAIPYLKENNNVQSYAIACNKMGMTLLAQGRNNEAIRYFREAADIFSANGDLRNEMHSRKGLYESYWGEYPDSAKMEIERFNDLKDTLYNNATAESLAKFDTEFEAMWLRLENQKQRTRGNIILTLCIILGLLWIITWTCLKRRSKIKEESLKNIISHLKGESPSEEQYPHLSDTNKQFLRQLVNSIMERISDKGYSVEALASDMCITSGHLNRKIKSITGITTQQYILRIRMEYAKHLLLNSPDLTISEVAYKCGFEDAASFSRAFRRTFDKSPSQMRQDRA